MGHLRQFAATVGTVPLPDMSNHVLLRGCEPRLKRFPFVLLEQPCFPAATEISKMIPDAPDNRPTIPSLYAAINKGLMIDREVPTVRDVHELLKPHLIYWPIAGELEKLVGDGSWVIAGHEVFSTTHMAAECEHRNNH